MRELTIHEMKRPFDIVVRSNSSPLESEVQTLDDVPGEFASKQLTKCWIAIDIRIDLIYFFILLHRPLERMSSDQKRAKTFSIVCMFWRHAQTASLLLITISTNLSIRNSNCSRRLTTTEAKPYRKIFRQIARNELMHEQFTWSRLNRWILILTPRTPIVRQQVFTSWSRFDSESCVSRPAANWTSFDRRRLSRRLY